MDLDIYYEKVIPVGMTFLVQMIYYIRGTLRVLFIENN